MVGVGSGPQDIGQYMISHTAPEERRANEKMLVEHYYEVLFAAIPSDSASASASGSERSSTLTWELCWREYVHGGVERWVWLLALIAGTCPDVLTQYFHNQVEAFALDHEITVENIGMPRV